MTIDDYCIPNIIHHFLAILFSSSIRFLIAANDSSGRPKFSSCSLIVVVDGCGRELYTLGPTFD